MLQDERALTARIKAYLEAQVGHPIEVGAIRRFPVGFSWLTYAVPVNGINCINGSRGQANLPADGELILRLGPTYGLYSPYSSEPQVLAMQSLQASTVPVPKVYWHSDDSSMLGGPFLFCEKVSGAAVVPWVNPSEPPLDEGYRIGLATQFVDTLAALHCIDWRDKPIAKMAQPSGDQNQGSEVIINVCNAARLNVEYWEKCIQRWAMRTHPMAEWGMRWLKDHAPTAPRVSIVHGDYRTGNFLEVGGKITSILDWELVHLGDPHEDLGWASLPMYMGGTKLISRIAESEWFYQRYSEKAGFEVSMKSLRYYQALSLLKLAATHMAAARCFEEVVTFADHPLFYDARDGLDRVKRGAARG